MQYFTIKEFNFAAAFPQSFKAFWQLSSLAQLQHKSLRTCTLDEQWEHIALLVQTSIYTKHYVERKSVPIQVMLGQILIINPPTSFLPQHKITEWLTMFDPNPLPAPWGIPVKAQHLAPYWVLVSIKWTCFSCCSAQKAWNCIFPPVITRVSLTFGHLI